MKKIEEIVICDSCKGTGRVMYCSFRSGSTPNCNTCEGSGRLLKIIELKPYKVK